MVERYNRTLEHQLAIFVNENQKDWDQHIPLLLMSYRTAIHEFTTDRMKTRYNLDATATKLNEGTPVWLFKPQRKKGVSPKLSKSWVGPYVVVKRINYLVYRIQMSERSKSMVVHRNRLRKYFGGNIPQFLSRSKTTQEHGPELRRSRRERRAPVRLES